MTKNYNKFGVCDFCLKTKFTRKAKYGLARKEVNICRGCENAHRKGEPVRLKRW